MIKPFGYIQAIVILVLCGACFVNRSARQSPLENENELRVFVGASGSGQAMPGVEVILLSSTRRVLGKTDYLGSFPIKKSMLTANHAYALLLCSERFFCGAIQIDRDLLEYEETYIDLAPFAVR
jgi:hypothetical protein